MATNSSTDFMTDLKGHAQTLLAGSLAFSTVPPLLLKIVNDHIEHFPILPPGIDGHIVLFYLVNWLYFVLPVVLGLAAWWSVKKRDRRDTESVVDFLEKSRLTTWQYRLLRWGPVVVLGLLGLEGTLIIYPWNDSFFHGPAFMITLFGAYWLFTLGLIGCGALFQWYFLRLHRLGTTCRESVKTTWSWWLLGLAVSGIFFTGAYFSFFDEHEGEWLFSGNKSKTDSTLVIELPFQWKEIAEVIDSVYVKPLESSYGHVAEQANLLAATSLDYNDFVLRQMPKPKFAWENVDGLQTSALEVRSQLLLAYDRARKLDTSKNAGKVSLNCFLNSLKSDHTVTTLLNHYDLQGVRFITPSDSAKRDSLRLILANQLMPLADNLAEAAESIQRVAEKQSHKLMADWVQITRLKGLFLLFCYLDLLLFGWFVIRLAEAMARKNARATGARRLAGANSAVDSSAPPKTYRELIYVKELVLMTALLILPLFRTVDEQTVSADQPFWFLSLPELLGSKSQILPNGYSSQENQTENHEKVMRRLDQIDAHVTQLEKRAVRLEKSVAGAHKAVEELTHQ